MFEGTVPACSHMILPSLKKAICVREQSRKTKSNRSIPKIRAIQFTSARFYMSRQIVLRSGVLTVSLFCFVHVYKQWFCNEKRQNKELSVHCFPLCPAKEVLLRRNKRRKNRPWSHWPIGALKLDPFSPVCRSRKAVLADF